MDQLIHTAGLTFAAALAVAFIFCLLGAKLHKSGAGIGVILATGLSIFCASRPLLGTFPRWPTNDATERSIWSILPLMLVALIVQHRKVPRWIQPVVLLLATGGLLVWNFSLIPNTSFQTLYTWASISAGLVLILWLLIEPIANRSPGIASPLIIGFLSLGIGSLYLNSDSTKSGTLVGTAGCVAAGTCLACFILPKLNFARGPVLLWLFALVILYVPSIYTEAIPFNYLAMILAAPVLAWVVELPGINRLKPWKKELLRGLLVAAPVLVAAYLGNQKHTQAAKDSGDEYGLIMPDQQSTQLQSTLPGCLLQRAVA